MKLRLRNGLVACALAATFVAAAVPVQAKDKLTVVMSSWDLLFWGTLTASELGLFDKEGMDVELVRAGGGAKSLAAVAGGDADFNIGAPASAFRANAKGSDVVMIAPAISQYTDNVTMSGAWAKKNNITSDSPYEQKLKALKGMTLAVSSVGGGASQLLRYLAKEAKLDPDRDITMTAISEGSSMLAAMSLNRIDGFVIPPPTGDDAIKNHGAQSMFATGRGEVKSLDGFVYIGVIARELLAEEEPGSDGALPARPAAGAEHHPRPRDDRQGTRRRLGEVSQQDGEGAVRPALGRGRAVLPEDGRGDAGDDRPRRQFRERDDAERSARHECGQEGLDERIRGQSARVDEVAAGQGAGLRLRPL